METLTLSREMFPALADSGHAYLNSGASGPPPYHVLERMREADDSLSGPAYLEGPGLFAYQRETCARAREAAARLLGAQQEDVALTQNTTHGMNLGAFSLNWREGDEVISATIEHPGCLVPLHALEQRHGVKLNLLEPPITAEKVEAAMTPRTRLLALSHVDWSTGEVLPLEDICAASRDRDVMTLVDGAQSVGNIAVDAPATGADLYALTGHKWLLGPEGMGALYVRPGCQAQSTSIGFSALADPSAFAPEGSYELHAGARRFECSTISPELAAGFTEAARAAHERGSSGAGEIQRRANLLATLLSELPSIKLRSPTPVQSGLVSFEVEGVESKTAAERLLERKFVVRHLPQPTPYVRASVHLFNPDEELEAFARVVGKL